MWSLLRSLLLAGAATLILLLIGYPVAYAMTQAPRVLQAVLVVAVILPFLTSSLIRIYAWVTILQRDGLLNHALIALGVFDQPHVWLATDTAVMIGLVYSYLPFFILPLYTNLVKLDPALLEASADLGARPFRTFLSITLPLSMPGVIAGAMLVFIPAIGEFVIPSLLGGPGTQMIGRILWDEFFSKTNWPRAAALAITMLVIIVIPIMLMQRAQNAVVEGRN